MTSADRSLNLFAVWNSKVQPHLAVVGRTGSGRASTVDEVISYFRNQGSTIVMVYPEVNPHLSLGDATAEGAVEAEDVLKQQLAELHRRYTAIEKHGATAHAPIVIVIDSLEELFSTTTDPQRIHRLQLDIEAIAILGKNVGLHLIFSSDELPYLAEQARRDLSTVVVAAEDDGLGALPAGMGWFFASGSREASAVQLEAGAAGSLP